MEQQGIAENILDGISVVADALIKKINADTTVKALIIDIVDSSLKKYKLEYEQATWIATAISSENDYQIGDLVLILLPNGDFSSGNKKILGYADDTLKIKTLGLSSESQYNIISEGCFTSDKRIGGNLCSYKNENKIIYSNIEEQDFFMTRFIEQSRYGGSIKMSMEVKTSLSQEQKKAFGIYGVEVVLKYEKDNIFYTDTKTFLSTAMPGDALSYETLVKPSFYFDLKTDLNFIGIENIRIFCDFELQDLNKDADIFISNINFYATKSIQENNLELIITPENLVFNNEETFKDVSASFLINRIISETVTNEAQYYWFKEDLGIVNTSADYNQYGGAGWRCLNEKSQFILNSYISTNNQFKIKKEICTTKENIFKCVAVYNNNIYSYEFIIINDEADFSINLTSSTETLIMQGARPVITCDVLQDNLLVDYSGFEYLWKIVDSDGNFIAVFNENALLNKNQVQINTEDIMNYLDIKCAVYKNNILIGTKKIRMNINEKNDNNSNYSIQLKNDGQTFYYNLDGSLSSTSENEALSLSFDLIKIDSGEKVDLQKNLDSNAIQIFWYIPKNNSLIDYSINQIDDNNEEYVIIKNTTELKYSAKEPYDLDKNNNLIQLKVVYQNSNYYANYNISCVRTGDPGTNGTGYCLDYNPKYGSPSNKAQLSKYVDKDNKLISSNFNINNFKEGAVYLNGKKTDIPVSTSIEYDNKWIVLSTNENTDCGVLTNIVPICVFKRLDSAADNYIFYLKRNTGFRTVAYTSQGNNPIYTKTNPFELIVLNRKGEDVSNNFDYIWSRIGNNLTITSTIKNRAFAVPSSIYLDSQNKNDGIKCAISINEVNYVEVIIPIFFYINTYGFSGINSFDGQSIQLNSENNGLASIMSPQLVAGEKDAKNRFTGVMIGQVKEYSNGNLSSLNGLFGFNKGMSTFHLNARDGSLRLGYLGGKNTIFFDPSIDNISLEQDVISLGDKQFRVTNQGRVYAKGGTFGSGVYDTNGTVVSGNIFELSEKGFVINGQKKNNEETESFSCSLELDLSINKEGIYILDDSWIEKGWSISDYELVEAEWVAHEDDDALDIVDDVFIEINEKNEDSEENDRDKVSFSYSYEGSKVSGKCYITCLLYLKKGYEDELSFVKTIVNQDIFANKYMKIDGQGANFDVGISFKSFNNYSDIFKVKTCSYSYSIDAQSAGSKEKTFFESNSYYPLGVVGYDIDGVTYKSAIFAINLKEAKPGSVKLYSQIGNGSDKKRKFTVKAKILWIKVE